MCVKFLSDLAALYAPRPDLSDPARRSLGTGSFEVENNKPCFRQLASVEFRLCKLNYITI